MLEYRTLPVTHFAQNCSIVWCSHTRQAAVIDPGGDLPHIHAALQALHLQPGQIWLTHAHIDHAGGAGELAATLGIPIIGPHPDDQFLIDGLAGQAQMFGFAPVQPFAPARWLHQGDVLTLGQCQLAVHHTPGHTPGHVVFHAADARLAFVGDVLFAGSIGRTDFPRGNHAQLLQSIAQRLWPWPDDTTFIPGHGPASTIGHEKRHNPFLAGLAAG